MTLLRNPLFAFWAYSQAEFCASTFERFGFFVALLMLFFCLFGNQMVAAWIRLP